MMVRYLLAEPELQYGCQMVRKRTGRDLRGLMQFGSITCPALTPELGALDRMLGDLGYGNPHLTPRGSPEEVRMAWSEWQ